MSSMEYAQARMQARLGARPGAVLWRELDGIRDLGAYLDAARGTPLRRWIAGVDAGGNLHQIDMRLRERYRDHVREVARWMPQAWWPAVLWLLQLIDLPALVHLLSGRAPFSWMFKEPGLRVLIKDGGGQGDAAVPVFLRSERNRRQGHAPDLDRARSAWLAEWERRWPAGDEETMLAMKRIVAAFSLHLERFRLGGMRDSWRLRARLEHELRILFRRFALRPEACFAYLGLIALDLERLRAQLVRRALWRQEGVAA